VRTVFVIDPQKKVRMMMAYPPSAGRNYAEILRAVDSLQLTDRLKVSTPVNWNPGDEVVISPSLSEAEAKKRFPQGWRTLKPYLRMVKLAEQAHAK
ncbi:MAG: peroxidase, partial [Acetobacteraceae bacterium]